MEPDDVRQWEGKKRLPALRKLEAFPILNQKAKQTEKLQMKFGFKIPK